MGRVKAPINFPMLKEIISITPYPGGKAGQGSGPKGGGLNMAGAQHLALHEITLNLHQEVTSRRATVHP